MDDFAIEIEIKKPDLIFVTETWLTQNIPDSLIRLSNYTLLRKDRIAMDTNGQTRRGGGVAIYIKNVIHGHQVTYLP